MLGERDRIRERQCPQGWGCYKDKGQGKLCRSGEKTHQLVKKSYSRTWGSGLGEPLGHMSVYENVGAREVGSKRE